MRLRSALLAVALASATLTTSNLVAPAADAASARTYAVDCKVKHNGDGSSTRPWNTLSAITKHGAFQPGDKILLKRGVTCKGRIVPSGSGTKTRPIVLGAYGKGARPVVNGGGTANQTATVQLVNVRYWTVQDLHVTNTGKSKRTTAYRSGVLLQNTGTGRLAGMKVQRLLVEKVASNVTMKYADSREWGGISAITYGVRNDGFDNLRIDKNTVRNVGRTGIVVSNKEHGLGWDRSTLISRNAVRSARGDGIVLRGTSGGRIARNVVANSGAMLPCPECHGVSPDTANAGIWPAQSKNLRIDHNEVYGQHVWGGDGEGFDIDSSTLNVLMESNYAHDNGGGGVLLCGSQSATVRFNIFENNKKSAIAFIGTYPAKQTAIYNNTIYSSSRSEARPVRYFNGARGKNITFTNNVVYNYGFKTWLWPTRPKTAANTLIGLHGAGRPTDGRTSYRDPHLRAPGSGRNGLASLSGYKPAKGYPALKGVAIPSSARTDFFGKKISPKHPPRGAAG